MIRAHCKLCGVICRLCRVHEGHQRRLDNVDMVQSIQGIHGDLLQTVTGGSALLPQHCHHLHLPGSL